jgi:hypothetical protein
LSGINGALYHHGAVQPSTTHLTDIERIATTELGDLVRTRTDVAPGGNDVEAFLDIAGPDAVQSDVLEGFLRDGANRMSGSSFTHRADSLALRFSCNPGLLDACRSLFHELAEAALLLRSSSAPQTSATLDISVTRYDQGWQYELDGTSQELVQQAFPGATVARSIKVPFDAADHLRREHGRLYPDIVEWLTTKPLEELRTFTIRFLSSGSLVWQWPR